jgi:glycosyltransferase involved in cell wall biosynthesis
VTSVVIPAHDEAAVIGRLLGALCPPGASTPDPLEVVVVCNGCTDGTADVVREWPEVRLIELTAPSKHTALMTGLDAITTTPCVLVDADVEIDAASIRALAGAFDGRLLAAAPARRVPLDRSSVPVRAYYAVWSQLPSVVSGLYGRGVIALASDAVDRVRALPPVMGDDLAISEMFAPTERGIVDGAVVTVHPPRTVRDLHRRRVRAATGNAQADAAGRRGAGATNSLGDLVRIGVRTPSTVPAIPVFVAVSLAGRLGARRAVRRRDFTTWRRDETSRT